MYVIVLFKRLGRRFIFYLSNYPAYKEKCKVPHRQESLKRLGLNVKALSNSSMMRFGVISMGLRNKAMRVKRATQSGQ